jgi:hypothetical protein
MSRVSAKEQDVTNYDGGPAFPFGVQVKRLNGYGDSEVIERNEAGMTLRDYFAAMAMQALIQTPRADWPDDFNGQGVADCAYEQADSMLEERNRT